MEEIVFCPKCHHANKKGAKVCEACGASLEEENEENENNASRIHTDLFNEDDTYIAPGYKERRNPTGSPLQVLTKPHPYTFGIATRVSLEMNLPRILIDVLLLLGCVAYFIYWELSGAELDMSFYLVIVLIVLEMLSVLNYIIFVPLRMAKQSKQYQPSQYRVEIYKDGILVEQVGNIEGENKLFLSKVLQEDITKIKEYRDIFLLRVSSPTSPSQVLVFLKENLNKAAKENFALWKKEIRQEKKN